MSSAKEEILGRVRAAIAAPAAAPWEIERSYRRTGELTGDQLIGLFCERVGDYRAAVERVHSDRLRDAIAAAAVHHGAGRLVIPAGLPSDWRPPELELIADDALTARQLDDLDGVVTGCTTAIAETGTIVLTAGPSEGRRVLSLVPDLHICVVEATQIVSTIPEAIAQLVPLARASHRPMTFISGPSATSDIELQRVEGVHGPRKLVVLVVEPAA